VYRQEPRRSGGTGIPQAGQHDSRIRAVLKLMFQPLRAAWAGAETPIRSVVRLRLVAVTAVTLVAG